MRKPSKRTWVGWGFGLPMAAALAVAGCGGPGEVTDDGVVTISEPDKLTKATDGAAVPAPKDTSAPAEK